MFLRILHLYLCVNPFNGWVACVVILTFMPSLMADNGDSAERPVVMLSVDLPDLDQKNEQDANLQPKSWIREAYRQAFLITARDDFRLGTRDALLGEPVDEDDPQCFHLSVLPWENDQIELRLRRGDEQIYQKMVRQDHSAAARYFPSLIRRTSAFRNDLTEVLEEAGFEYDPMSDSGVDELPAETEQLLQEMNHVSQYLAVRQLHALMREQGESVAVLGGLVRGYAHLTQLTLPVLDLRHRAFGMRSLLYATQLTRLEPSSPVGHWHSAYAYVWTGYCNGASDELKKAVRKADGEDEPPWLDVVRYAITYDFAELERVARDETNDLREIAALQWYLATRLTSSPAFMLETGLAVEELIPECLRVIAGMAETAGVALNHRLSVTGPPAQALSLRRTLDQLRTLPGLNDLDLGASQPAQQARTDEFDFSDDEEEEKVAEIRLRDLTEPLRNSGATDRAEPSLFALASNLEAWRAQHLFTRALFLRYFLGVDADDFVEGTASEIADERFRPLYQTLGVPQVSPPNSVHQFTQQLIPFEVNYTSRGYDAMNWLPWAAPTSNGTVRELVVRGWRGSGLLEDSWAKKIRAYSEQERFNMVKSLHKVSENAPMYYAELILVDWDNHKDKADEWDSKFPGYPDLQWSLARSRKRSGEFDQAIRHYQNYLSMVRDANGYIGMSEAMYMRDPEGDEWMDALDESLECEDYHLTHAKAAQQGASTLMRDGRFEDAYPWAELAAQSGSGWGMSCFAECLTGLGEFDVAEEYVQASSRRYSSDTWFYWCAETGQGDLDAAWSMEEQRLNVSSGPDGGVMLFTRALRALAGGNIEAALPDLKRVAAEPLEGLEPRHRVAAELLVAVLADRLGQSETRDQYLQRLADEHPEEGPDENADEDSGDDSDDEKAEPVRVAGSALARLLLEASGDEELTAQRLEQIAEKYQAVQGWPTLQPLIVGCFLRNRDRNDEAIEQWKITARQEYRYWDRLIAWTWLRGAGVDPIHVRDRRFPDMFAEAPNQDE